MRGSHDDANNTRSVFTLSEWKIQEHHKIRTMVQNKKLIPSQKYTPNIIIVIVVQMEGFIYVCVCGRVTIV